MFWIIVLLSISDPCIRFLLDFFYVSSLVINSGLLVPFLFPVVFSLSPLKVCHIF